MKKHNKNLAGVAKQAGVVQPVDYAIFMDHGYRGLYGGLGMRDVRERKRLKPKKHLLDHMGSTELAANLFRATQTEEKLRRENVRNKDQANRIHSEVGRKRPQRSDELIAKIRLVLQVADVLPFHQKTSQHPNRFVGLRAFQRELQKRVDEFAGIRAVFLEMVVDAAFAFI